MKEVAPTKLLPYLNLTNNDKENIRCDERNKGKTEATLTLLDKLKKQNGPNGQKAFDELVRALRNIGNQQSALLLDPHFKGKKLNIFISSLANLRTLSVAVSHFLNCFLVSAGNI